MRLKDVLFVVGAVGTLGVFIFLLKGWLRWRTESITKAGKALDFQRLDPDEELPVVLVPLLARRGQRFFLIMRGELQGCDAAFFDLYHSSGNGWSLQSAVLVNNPGMIIPGFQLRPKPFWQTSPLPRPCGEIVDLAGREMRGLQFSSEDATWASAAFAHAPRDFFEKVRRGKWAVEGSRHSIVLYRFGTRIPARKLKGYMKEAGEIAVEAFSFLGEGGSGSRFMTRVRLGREQSIWS